MKKMASANPLAMGIKALRKKKDGGEGAEGEEVSQNNDGKILKVKVLGEGGGENKSQLSKEAKKAKMDAMAGSLGGMSKPGFNIGIMRKGGVVKKSSNKDKDRKFVILNTQEEIDKINKDAAGFLPGKKTNLPGFDKYNARTHKKKKKYKDGGKVSDASDVNLHSNKGNTDEGAKLKKEEEKRKIQENDSEKLKNLGKSTIRDEAIVRGGQALARRAGATGVNRALGAFGPIGAMAGISYAMYDNYDEAHEQAFGPKLRDLEKTHGKETRKKVEQTTHTFGGHGATGFGQGYKSKMEKGGIMKKRKHVNSNVGRTLEYQMLDGAGALYDKKSTGKVKRLLNEKEKSLYRQAGRKLPKKNIFNEGGEVLNEMNDKEGYNQWKTDRSTRTRTNISPLVSRKQHLNKHYEDNVDPDSKGADRKSEFVERKNQGTWNQGYGNQDLMIEAKEGRGDIKRRGLARGLFNRKTEKGLVKKKYDDELSKDSEVISGARASKFGLGDYKEEKAAGREQRKYITSGEDSDGDPIKTKIKTKGIRGRDIPTEMNKEKMINENERKFVDVVDGKRVKKRGATASTAREYKRRGLRRVYTDPDAEGNVQYVGTGERATRRADRESGRDERNQRRQENKAIRQQKQQDRKATRKQNRQDFRQSFGGDPGSSYSSGSNYGDYEEGGVAFNKPKRTPNHPKKSHIVVVRKPGGGKKTIRFGQQGVTTAGKPKEGESQKQKNRRKSFKARHGKNIAKGKMSAAYWANKVKWEDGGVNAPKGLHWMKKGEGKYKLMKHGDKPFKKHAGASLKAKFPIQKKHNPKQDARMAKRKYV